MSNYYFFTGFPGFLAAELIKQIVLQRQRYPIGHIYLLALPELFERAQAKVEEIAAEGNVSAAQFTIVPGDITKKQLHLPMETRTILQEKVTHVFHLAAIYDLAVEEAAARQVNVIGTQHVNDWVRTLDNLQRYVYFSTAYVAGKREGNILEIELDMGQSFKNHYESTKYEAEVLVQQLTYDLPTTVIRPGVVRGHSATGETIKFDGPYFMLNFFDRLRFLPFIPYLGPGEATFNTVPSDYIIEAAIYLGHADVGKGKTYHLTDPKPYKMREVYRLLMETFLGKTPCGTIPLSLARGLLSIPAARKWLRVEKEALDYSITPSDFDTTQAKQDLMGTGIACPDFKDTLEPMVRFYDAHKNDPDKHLDIP